MSAQSGIFQREGISWSYKGRIAYIRDLELARIATKELEKLGFTLETASNPTYGVYDFLFAKLGERPGVVLRYLPESRKMEPYWEIAVLSNTAYCLVRFIDDTFRTRAQAEDRLSRERRTISCELIVRPTLNF